MPENVNLHLVPKNLVDIENIAELNNSFDVIIIDGCDRFIATQKSFRLLNPEGLLIVDNSEGYWGTDGTYPIIDFLHGQGLLRIDLYGFTPGVIDASCTSIFFRNNSFVVNLKNPPSSRYRLQPI